MSAGTSIEWTDQTWNPVTGCSKVSPGCDHCYMFQMYPRLRAFGVLGYQKSPDVVTVVPDRLNEPARWKGNRRVFVNSMSDTFHRDVPPLVVAHMFQTMRKLPQHQFQVLTKRPGGAAAFSKRFLLDDWPRNVWLGTSIENQKYAPRYEVLARVPAAIRFVSAEPLLGPLDLTRWLGAADRGGGCIRCGLEFPEHALPGETTTRHICPPDWVIIGGESGPGARPMELEWARAVLQSCQAAGVPVFVKQLGSAWARENGARHAKGGDPLEWPVDLKVREFPEAPTQLTPWR